MQRKSALIAGCVLALSACAEPQQLLAPGDIVMSTLSIQQFQAAHGGDGKWVLCNGSTYPGTALATASGDTNGKVPDFQGRYPRGFAQGSTPAVGLTQEDAIQSHEHQLAGLAVISAGVHGGYGQVVQARNGANTPTSEPLGIGGKGVNVDTETRPKTTVVNFFCRVN